MTYGTSSQGSSTWLRLAGSIPIAWAVWAGPRAGTSQPLLASTPALFVLSPWARGISDWYTYHVSNDVPDFTTDYLSGSPFRDREPYVRAAPMSNLANAKTPMRTIQHGASRIDAYRCRMRWSSIADLKEMNLRP